MEYKAREYQRTIISHILHTPRCAIFASMGLGKTVSTLASIWLLQQRGCGKALILAPLRVAASTWPAECRKWENIPVTCSAVVGSAKKRLAALDTEADIYTTNYENLPWLVENTKIHFDIIVADESTRLKGFRNHGSHAARTKALNKIAWDASRFIELTGTPCPNGLEDLWGQMYFLDKGERLGTSMTKYHDEYFNGRQIGSNRFAIRWTPKKGAENIVEEKISDLCVSLRTEDYFELSSPIVSNVVVELPKSSKDLYNDLKKEMVVEVENSQIMALSAASVTTKCLQICSGVLYHDDTFTLLHDEKIEALKSIISEGNGAPVLVAYHWKSDAERILNAIPSARLLDKDPKTIDEWNDGKIQVLLLHPMSAGHGLNLARGGNIIVFFSHWWDLETYQQVIERIGPVRQMSAGFKRNVFIYNIIAKGTLDEAVIERRITKKSVQDALLEHLGVRQ